MKRSIIGITAHVDSGKTTLSEAMLYISGEIRKLGRVDNGDSFLDNFAAERSRGITVFSKQAIINYRDTEFILLDTPGHIDFTAETERTFSVLDAAVLVISGSEGIQSHTETLWKMLCRHNIPVFIFVNKMDLSFKSESELMEEIQNRLGGKCIHFGIERESAAFYEDISLCSEDIMNEYLESGAVSAESISHEIQECKIFPVTFGSALRLNGVKEFMDTLSEYTAEKKYPSDFGALVYKITSDNGVRLTHMKITGGVLNVRAALKYGNTEEKASRIRIYSGAKYNAAAAAEAGMLAAAEGLTATYAGQGLGIEKNAAEGETEPVLQYCAESCDGTDIHSVLNVFRILEEEDPKLYVMWNEDKKEIRISVMGEIQLEILSGIILERFGIHIKFVHGSILYKETITDTVEGVGHFEPLRHYAEVHLKLEPLPQGEGVVYCDECMPDTLSDNYRSLIISMLKSKTHIGALTGSPITDIRITLIGGRSHLKHTEGGDFRQAAFRAVRQGLRTAGKQLLEPWYSFRIEVPVQNVGRVLSDVKIMGGEVTPPETGTETAVIEGSAPVSEIYDYPRDVTVFTKGKGRVSFTFKGYFPCHNTDEIVSQVNYDCDGDIANTADSVFCTHGAGYTVKWDEAPKKMHMGSLMSEVKKEEYAAPSNQQLESYKKRLYDDKELMEIFERTYGKIRRDDRVKMRRDRHTEYVKPSSKPVMPKGEEYLLVDGYNMIFSWEELKKTASESLDAARSILINRLCNYQGFKGGNVILVFDAYKVKGNFREVENYHNISVVYTKEAETADAYIEKTAHDLSKEYRVRVATSDNQEQIIILGNGALRISAGEFELEVKAAEKAIADYLNVPQKRFTGIRSKDEN